MQTEDRSDSEEALCCVGCGREGVDLCSTCEDEVAAWDINEPEDVAEMQRLVDASKRALLVRKGIEDRKRMAQEDWA